MKLKIILCGFFVSSLLGVSYLHDQLCNAVKSGVLEDVRTLLSETDVKNDINLPGKDGEPVLHWAAIRGDLEMVSLLLDHGADPCLIDGEGDTPLHSAALGGNVEVVRFLLSHGAVSTLNAVDKFGYTPLHDAAFRGWVEVTRLLLDQPSLTTASHVASKNGFTPLDAALSKGHFVVAEIIWNYITNHAD